MRTDAVGSSFPEPVRILPARTGLPATPALDVVLLDSTWIIAALGGFRCYRTQYEFTLSVHINSDRAHASPTGNTP